MVRGHWRSKPSSIQPLPSTVSEYYIPNVTSTSKAPQLDKSYYEFFERGFVGGQPYVKLVVKEKNPTSITEPAYRHQLEFSCVKTTDTVIESIDYVTTTMETVGGKVVDVDRRYSLKEANLWIGGKVFRGATMQNMFYIDGSIIHEIDGSLNELTFSMKRFRKLSDAVGFLRQCKHLWTL
jgi:hypothetical protein